MSRTAYNSTILGQFDPFLFPSSTPVIIKAGDSTISDHVLQSVVLCCHLYEIFAREDPPTDKTISLDSNTVLLTG